MQGYVAAINVSPLKSGRAIFVPRAEVNERGLAYDREWMVVDDSGKFLSQRDVPRLTLVTSHIGQESGGGLFSAPHMPTVFVGPLAGILLSRIRVTVHKDSCDALDQGDQASQWFTEFLDMPARLVRVDPTNPRMHHSSALGREFPMNFQDGSHILIISRASRDDLNDRMRTPVPADRLRSTIEVDGILPYGEDDWRGKHLRIGQMEMLGANLNVRCVITTIDQQTGLSDPHREPLGTLATYRKNPEGGVVFGINCYVIKPGIVNVGDTVEVLG